MSSNNTPKIPAPSSTIQKKSAKFKQLLYQLIINQLVQDGYIGAADEVAKATMTPFSFAIQKKHTPLADLVQKALDMEKESQKELLISEVTTKGLDLDVTDKEANKTKITNFITRFITTHKGACRVAKFTWDGKYVATGSADCSLKLLDVEKMHYHHQTKAEVEDYAAARPVIRTFYDHTQPINDVDFHPSMPIILSASRDCTIKLFDYTKASVKRSFRQIQESHNVRSISMHPSGDFLLVGTDHNLIRTYDLNTFQCFTSSNPQDHHFSPINQVRYSLDGKLFVSGGKDGQIKIWDGVTGRCVNTIIDAHEGEVYSVQFSRNMKYLLSGGQDYKAKLWDLSTGRQLRLYKIRSSTTKSKSRFNTTFNYNEDFVITSDKADIVLFDTRTAEQTHKLGGHNKLVRWVASSPAENAFMSCSDDQRARFWAARESDDE